MYVARYFDIKCWKKNDASLFIPYIVSFRVAISLAFNQFHYQKRITGCQKDLCEHISLQKDFAFTMKTLINNNGWF